MIETTVTLTCDRCGREIKTGDHYYVEDIDLHHFMWDGEGLDMIEGEDMERRTRDLCEECRIGLYGPKEDPGEKAVAIMGKEPVEEQACTTPAIVAVEDLDRTEIPSTAKESVAEEFPYIPPQSVAMPAVLEIPPEEPRTTAEDAATGEAVELDGKTYTEYHRTEPIVQEPINPKPEALKPEEPEPIVREPITPKSETPEPPLEAREAAARILAMAAKKPRKRLTREQKEQITKRMKQGKSCAKVGEELGIPPQTVWNVWHKWKEEHNGE